MTAKKTSKKLTPEATIEQIVTTGPNAATLLDSIGLKPEQNQLFPQIKKTASIQLICKLQHYDLYRIKERPS